jgi:GTPase SAR1 family protein
MPGIKIIIMGVGGVGKSAITKRLVIGSWEEKVIIDFVLTSKICEFLTRVV